MSQLDSNKSLEDDEVSTGALATIKDEVPAAEVNNDIENIENILADEDNDDDDDFSITIGKLNEETPLQSDDTHTPINFNIGKDGPSFGPGGQVKTNKSVKSKSNGLSIEEPGLYEGTPIFELNLETIKEKPWRKPGADITDYFNYGFTEDTWKMYCERRKNIQSEFSDRGNGIDNASDNVAQPISASHSRSSLKNTNAYLAFNSESSDSIVCVNENSKYFGMGSTRKAGPPPKRTSGAIDTIGGGTPTIPSVITSRRPQEPLMSDFDLLMSQSAAGMPGSPFNYPPPQFGIPPPHTGLDFFPSPSFDTRRINSSVIGSIQSSMNYLPPLMVDDNSMLKMFKREKSDETREGIENDQEREILERRERKQERDERDRRDRWVREKYIKKDRRDSKERRDDDRRHRNDKVLSDERYLNRKRIKSESPINHIEW